MAATPKTAPLIVIVGPTASGKSKLAMQIAQEYNGAIISADSRAIYKHLDIGTAKPTPEDQAAVEHFGIDLIEPNEIFSAAQFQQDANQWISEAYLKGKIPIMVGGTGLYIDSILFNYKFGQPADNNLRHRLAQFSLEELWKYCKNNNIDLPENYKNRRYVIRAIEQKGINTNKARQLRRNTIIVGITSRKSELLKKIQHRINHMYNNGVVEEATSAAASYGWNSPGLSGNIYPIVHTLIEQKITKKEAIQKSIILDWRLAKRQMTWFKRNQHILWQQDIEQAYTVIKDYLSKKT